MEVSRRRIIKLYQSWSFYIVYLVYFLLSDEGVLAVFEKTEDGEASTTESKLTAALTKKDAEGHTVLNKVINELDKNENTKSLIPLVGKVAISALYDTLGIPEL